jgi:CDP-diacylglycerol pyrophosphatase
MLVMLGPALNCATLQADPDALWHLIHDQCVPNMQQHYDPLPCVRVSLSPDEEHGYAVIKDIVGAHQYLVIPTGRITGIESPDVAAPDHPNYFALAWQAREFVEQRVGGPVRRDWLSLAVNAANARSQNQLHIHIDCIDAGVHAALQAYGEHVGSGWAPFPVPLAGRSYLAMAAPSEDLNGVNPFERLAAAPFLDPAGTNLVVVGADPQSGSGMPRFFLLANQADDGGGAPAGGEALQDHDRCPAPEPITGSTSK